MSNDSELRVGDIVKLKSGGPNMTVAKIDINLAAKKNEIQCKWFAGKSLQMGTFNPQTLEIVKLSSDQN